MIPIIVDDGAYNFGHHWGGMEEQLVGESQINVICGLSLFSPTLLWNDGDGAAERMGRGECRPSSQGGVANRNGGRYSGQGGK